MVLLRRDLLNKVYIKFIRVASSRKWKTYLSLLKPSIIWIKLRCTRLKGVVARGVARLNIILCILLVLHASHYIVEGLSVSLAPIIGAERYLRTLGPT
jgi:heme O synthase-like polyprenyltransferase